MSRGETSSRTLCQLHAHGALSALLLPPRPPAHLPLYHLASCTASAPQLDPDVRLAKLWYLAADAGNLAKMKALKQERGKCWKGVNPRTGQNALHRAAFNGRVELATWLLEECKQDPNEAEAEYGITPL